MHVSELCHQSSLPYDDVDVVAVIEVIEAPERAIVRLVEGVGTSAVAVEHSSGKQRNSEKLHVCIKIQVLRCPIKTIKIQNESRLNAVIRQNDRIDAQIDP